MSEWWQDQLAELRHHWDTAYIINYVPEADRWVAQRHDDLSAVTAGSADGLREAIVADYAGRPVPRKDNGSWLP